MTLQVVLVLVLVMLAGCVADEAPDVAGPGPLDGPAPMHLPEEESDPVDRIEAAIDRALAGT